MAVGLYSFSRLTAALFALALAAGCSGQASAPGDQLAGAAVNEMAAPAAQLQGMPPLPAPGAISRGASLIETGLTLKGSSFRPDLKHQNVRVEGDLCVYDPAFLSGDSPQYDEVALSIFSFSLMDSSSDPVDVSSLADFNLDGQLDLVIGTAHVFAGFPSVAMDKWEWTELQKSSSPSGEPHSFVWSMRCPSDLHSRAPEGVLNVCIVVFGDTELSCSRLSFKPAASTTIPLSTLFRKGWDGTIKGRTAFDQSVSVCVDDASTVHCSYYDSSCGQLYHLRVDDRVVITQAVDCDVESGLTNNLFCAPDGSLLLSYWGDDDDDGFGTGRVRQLEPTKLEWPNFVSFDDGDDGSGEPPHNVGSRSSFVWDTQQDLPCIFYEDSSSGRIKLASRLNGLPPGEPYISSFVSPPGVHASSPVALYFNGHVGVLYIADTDNNRSTNNHYVLCYTVNGIDWSSSTLGTDVHNPDPRNPDCAGFCDVRVSGSLLVCAYSSSSGGTLSVFDISDPASPLLRSSSVFDPSSSSGAFCDLELLDDLSVRLVHCNVFDSTLYMVYTPSVAEPSFTCTSVELDVLDDDQDCDDLDFVINPNGGDFEKWEGVLVTLSSSFSALTQQRKHELTGHVTLMK